MVWNRNIGIFQLPKGRKNFDEGYLDAALRETAEETGVATQPLQLKFGSRSTPPKSAQTKIRDIDYGVEDKYTGITMGLSNETIGVSEWYVRQHRMASLRSTFLSSQSRLSYRLPRKAFFVFAKQNINTGLDPDPATGAWRHIYWFAAEPLHGIERDEGLMSEEDQEKFSTHWFDEERAVSNLKLKDEKFSKSIAMTYAPSLALLAVPAL
ncbi:hypothetical protein GGS23DRAFT_579750 [Durotheca rogersii]|uniref:uncharacterized protein n=1 Tax=Durotheca rogersii TaxID=419775 RepID=UPI00221E39A6|nr:uncharacterized protein GGS23DRAFT_579750 [Durotheca rogersii]KAI5860674.1 hypothetical protein GGS23DRAFT_579750 [Durotheca rogersii]